MRNVAFMTPDLKSGGSERVASRLTKLLSERYNVFYIVFGNDDKSYEIAGKLINLNVPSTPVKWKRYINIVRKRIKLRRVCRENNIDILFSFTYSANTTMRISDLDCKCVGSCRGFADLRDNTVNYHKTVSSGADMLFNSKAMENFYLSKYPQDKDKVFTIENLFDCADIEKKAKEELSEEEANFYSSHTVVSNCGTLNDQKGQWDLIKSFELLKEKVPDAGLVIVGHDGAYENDIRDMAERSKYSADIMFTGYTANPFKYMYNSNVYALSSINEGFPNALIEAMICSTPVVATDCQTGPFEVLSDEKSTVHPSDGYILSENGILTPCFDGRVDFDLDNKNENHRIFADALAKILTDTGLAKQYTEKGQKRAYQNDESLINEQYFDFIESRFR